MYLCLLNITKKVTAVLKQANRSAGLTGKKKILIIFSYALLLSRHLAKNVC
jgi:hypothetical protein